MTLRDRWALGPHGSLLAFFASRAAQPGASEPRWRNAWPSLLLVVLLLITAAHFVRMARYRDDIAFLSAERPAQWILYPIVGSSEMHKVVRLETVFRRTFSLPSRPGEASLRVRALRQAVVRLNGQVVSFSNPSGSWKQDSRQDVAALLRPGKNEISVTVSNDRGPAALWLVLECPEVALASDLSWEASRMGATWQSAVLATDPIAYPNLDPDGIGERVGTSLQKVWAMWLMFAGLSGLVVLGCWRWLAQSAGDAAATARKWTWIGRGTFLLIAVVWTAMFLHNSPYLLPIAGFDAPSHLDYVNYIRQNGRLPLPDEGFEMYHPPLYYLLAAILTSLSSENPMTVGGLLVIRVLNLAIGLAGVALIWACLRLLFPDHPRRQILGLIFAAFLPMHLYLYQYPTNEILLATLASAVVYLTLRILCAAASRARDYAMLGLALGASLLAKVSAVLLIPPVAIVLAARAILDRQPGRWSRAAGHAALLAAVLFAACGWHYMRVWYHFGRPVVTNADADVGYAWWKDPGYHTWADFSRFGQSFRAPLFSSCYSISEALYSTCWADTECGSVPNIDYRVPWRYDFLAAGFLLSVLPTAAILLGAAVAIAQFVRRPTIAWALLLALMFLAVLFVVDVALTVPAFGLKAFYGSVAIVPLCALAAMGLDYLSGPWQWLRAIVFVALGVWACNNAVTYWVEAGGVEAQLTQSLNLFLHGDTRGAIAQLEPLLQSHPQDARARLRLGQLYAQAGRMDLAEQVLMAECAAHDMARFHRLLGTLYWQRQRGDEALRELRKAVDLGPDDADAAWLYARALERQGNAAAAIDACRNVLRIDPYKVECHALLARLYAQRGESNPARQHREYVTQLTDRKQS
jgi:Flp pilus assembly protein TadD